MNLADVMDEVADQLDTIEGLRVHAHPVESVSAPAAIVTYPEDYPFDATYARGMDRITLPVVVMVGKVSDRAARDRVAAYCDGSGPRSFKAVLDAGSYDSFHTIRVVSVEFDVGLMSGVAYLMATFDLDIAGQGA